MELLFELTSIEKYYGPHRALSIPHLIIDGGKIYAVAGPNGAGKSTLLRILNLVEPPSSGSLKFLGREVSFGRDSLKLRRQMSALLQEPYLWNTSVFKNVALPLLWRGLNREEVRGRVAEALKAVGLVGFEGRRARELSGGEAKRVAIARAIAIRPKVLFLDEPTSNVDEESCKLIEGLIGGMKQREGVTIIMATHDALQAEGIADEVIYLSHGRLVGV